VAQALHAAMAARPALTELDEPTLPLQTSRPQHSVQSTATGRAPACALSSTSVLPIVTCYSETRKLGFKVPLPNTES
jgi:hypothetical protein